MIHLNLLAHEKCMQAHTLPVIVCVCDIILSPDHGSLCKTTSQEKTVFIYTLTVEVFDDTTHGDYDVSFTNRVGDVSVGSVRVTEEGVQY